MYCIIRAEQDKKERKDMEKYDEIIKSLDEKIKKINENKLISYSEKAYVMFLAIKKNGKELQIQWWFVDVSSSTP